METDPDHPSAKRYDCFISFHGSQHLSTLGFEGPGFNCTVRDLANDVYNHLSSLPRNPSVFYDQEEIVGHWPESLSRAILQLRGGGVALVLLTADYFTRKYCLAELSALLYLERLRTISGRKGEAIDIRVVVLEEDGRAAPDALLPVAVKEFVGTKLRKVQWSPLPVEKRSTRLLVVGAICEHVKEIWNGKEGMCLGAELKDCVYYLAHFFDERDCPRIVRRFGFRPDDFRHALTVDSVFIKALDEGKFSQSFYLSELDKATNDDRKKVALASFRRKWISDAWSWSLDQEDGICFKSLVSKAERALQ